MFRITNPGAERRLMHLCGQGTGTGAGGQTRAADDTSREPPGEACAIGGSGPVYGDVSAVVPEHNSVQARVLFKHVSPSARRLAIITVIAFSEGLGRFRVSFENIPIER
jgi:hypothetical protein